MCISLVFLYFCLANGLFVSAVDYILKNNSFSLKLDCAKCALAVFSWIKLHQREAEKFEETIVASLNTCLHQPMHVVFLP